MRNTPEENVREFMHDLQQFWSLRQPNDGFRVVHEALKVFEDKHGWCLLDALADYGKPKRTKKADDVAADVAA